MLLVELVEPVELVELVRPGQLVTEGLHEVMVMVLVMVAVEVVVPEVVVWAAATAAKEATTPYTRFEASILTVRECVGERVWRLLVYR